MTIINLTQHAATLDQKEAGVTDLTEAEREGLANLLTIKMGGENGFAALSKASQDWFLQSRASEIIVRFVTPRSIEKAEQALHCACDGLPGPIATGVYALELCRRGASLTCMVGGFRPLVNELERQLHALGHETFDALSERQSVEMIDPDTGAVRKTLEFAHLGFYENSRGS